MVFKWEHFIIGNIHITISGNFILMVVELHTILCVVIILKMMDYFLINIHLTLKFLGHIPEEKINEVKKVLDGLKNKFKTFPSFSPIQ